MNDITSGNVRLPHNMAHRISDPSCCTDLYAEDLRPALSRQAAKENQPYYPKIKNSMTMARQQNHCACIDIK